MKTTLILRDELVRRAKGRAALVRQHKMPIVSRDQHFDKVKGVRRLDW